MLRLASDVDVHGAILRGLWRHNPDIDLARVQDILPVETHDTDVLS